MTALFAAAVFASLAFMYMHTSAELAPEEDQGVLFALTKAPQYANLDYLESYTATSSTQAFSSFPETDLRFIVNGRYGPNQGIAGAILQALGRALAFGPAAEAADAAKGVGRRRAERLRLLAAALARIDRRPAGADGDQLDRRLQRDLRGDGQDQGCGAQERAVHGHRQRSRFQPADDPGQDRPLEGQ